MSTTTWQQFQGSGGYFTHDARTGTYATAYKTSRGVWVLTTFRIETVVGVPTPGAQIDSCEFDTLAECKGVMAHYNGLHVGGREPLTVAIDMYYRQQRRAAR